MTLFRRILAILTFICLATLLSASEPAGGRWSGVYRLYDFDTQRADADAPKGFKVCGISHYGRHGSRFLYFNHEYDILDSVFGKAAESGKLTPAGEEFRKVYASMYDDMKGRAGDLTTIGQDQHRRLACRMYEDYRPLFGKETEISAETSVVPRCIMSMAAFCEGLKSCDRKLEIHTEVNSASMPVLVPNSASNPARKDVDNPWKEILDAYFPMETQPVLDRLFTDGKYPGKPEEEKLFIQTLYYFVCHLDGTEFADSRFPEILTEDELRALYLKDNLKFYLNQGTGKGEKGAQNLALTRNLLESMMEQVDNDLEDGNPFVRLRFGHDGVVMGLLSLLDAEGFSEEAEAPEQVENVFHTCDIPMAANVRMVFFRKGDEVIFRFHLNERDHRLPLKTVYDKFYRWEDFKAFYAEEK